MPRLCLSSVLALSVLAVGVAVGTNATPSQALGDYIVNSSAGCQALLDDPDVDGSISGTECIVTSSTTISSATHIGVWAGWTLTLRPSSELTILAAMDVLGGGTLRIEGPVTNGGALFVVGGNLVVAAPFTNTDLVFASTATVTVQADLMNSNTWENPSSSVSIAGATFTNAGTFNNVIGGSVTVIEAPVCGAFVNTGAFGPTPVVDACTPKVGVEQAVSQADPTPAGPVLFTVTWGEDVTGFDLSCVQVSFTGTLSGTADSITGGPREYTVSVSVAGEGTVALSVPAGCLADGANNLSADSTSVDNAVAVALPEPAEPDPDLTPTGGGSSVALPALLLLMAGGALVLAGRRRSATR